MLFVSDIYSIVACSPLILYFLTIEGQIQLYHSYGNCSPLILYFVTIEGRIQLYHSDANQLTGIKVATRGHISNGKIILF